MKQEKIIDPVLFWLPLLCLITFVFSSVMVLVSTKILLLKVLLTQFLPLLWITFALSGAGIVISLVALGLKHKIKSYIFSFSPTFDFHEALKIYPSYSDFREKQQQLSKVARIFNSCVRSSYVWKTQKNIRFVIQAPKNTDAQDLFSKKLPSVRADLVARYPCYSFSDFTRSGSYYVLEGTR